MLETSRSSSGTCPAVDATAPDAPSDSGEHARGEREVPAHSGMRELARSRFARAWRQRERVVLEGADWALDGSTLLFALWTLCCHLTVLRHGNGTQLFVTFGLALPSALFALTRTRIAPARPALLLPPLPSQPRTRRRLPWRTAIGVAAALAVVQAWRELHDPGYFWIHSVAFLLISSALVFSQPAPVSARPAPLERWQGWLLWALGLASAAYTALLHRPNSDDTLYLNIAATVRDHPEYELFARDTLHGHGMTLLRAYAASSVELFAGFVGWLTHTSALKIMHLSLGPIAGLLTAFALARLFRLLEPERWPWLLLVALTFYVIDGAHALTIAGHGFIRMFQGKAMLASMGVPLISANAVAFTTGPSRWRWLTFAASVIMGIGLSSTGLWLALLVGATGLLVALRFDRAYLKALAWGGLALLYPLAFALWMRSQIAVAGGEDALAALAPHAWPELAKSAASMTYMLNGVALGKVAYLYVAFLLLAWPLARNVLLRRYLVLFALGGFAVLLNPVLSTFVATNLTGNTTYSRVLWYLPFAAAFATCFSAALPAQRSGRLALIAGGLVTACALAWFALANPRLSPWPYVRFPPEEKVDVEGCAVSRWLAHNMDDQSVVLAPVAVSLCLPMVQHSPYALMTKPKFFDDGGSARFALRRIIDGGHRALVGVNRRKFIGALQDFAVRGVVLTRGVEETSGVLGTLEIAGFHEAQRFPSYLVFLREEPWPLAP